MWASLVGLPSTNWLTVVLQCYDAVGWVMWPVKSTPKWPVSSRTLNPILSLVAVTKWKRVNYWLIQREIAKFQKRNQHVLHRLHRLHMEYHTVYPIRYGQLFHKIIHKRNSTLNKKNKDIINSNAAETQILYMHAIGQEKKWFSSSLNHWNWDSWDRPAASRHKLHKMLSVNFFERKTGKNLSNEINKN